MLAPSLNDPAEARPSLDQILADEWFTVGTFPDRIPSRAHDSLPDFSHISAEASRANFMRAKRECVVGRDLPLHVPEPAPMDVAHARQVMAPAIAQQEREFKAAVKPDSPISALLNSARKPPVVAPALPAMPRGEPSLLRKFQSQTAKSPLRKEQARAKPVKERVIQDLEALGEEGDIEEYEDEVPAPATKQRGPMSPAAEHRLQARARQQAHVGPAAGRVTRSVAKKQRRSKDLYDQIHGHITAAMECLQQGVPYENEGETGAFAAKPSSR